MRDHVHEALHVAAATLFVVAGSSALLEYRNLRERVVLTYGVMCLFAAGYASHVVISHNLPKEGAFWIPWTSVGLLMTFGATFFYLVTMRSFVGLPGRLVLVPLAAQAAILAVALGDLLLYAVAGRSILFLPIPRSGVGAHQRQLGEGAYSLLPTAEVVAAVFMLSFVVGIAFMVVHLLRTRERDALVYVGLFVTSSIVVNEALVAMGVYAGVYLLAFSKSLETLRIHHDIRVRARERVETRLRQAEKMETIGRMAGGIAHDFNNILTAVGGGVDIATSEVGDDHAAAPYLAIAQEGVETGRRIVQQLLDIARSRDDDEPAPIDVSQFLSDYERFLSMMVPTQTRLVIEVEGDVGYVEMSPAQLSRVLMNLIVNAGHAMPGGGTITVRASSAPSSSATAPRGAVPAEVVITVVDSGRGIPPAMLEHVFEPFFSTKLEEGGSGLGLATVDSIVRGANGRVEIESEVGHGTTFHVYLPRVDPTGGRGTSAQGGLQRKG